MLVPGVHIHEYIENKCFSSTDAISGILDGVKYSVLCMKEPEYVMNVMATNGVHSSREGRRLAEFRLRVVKKSTTFTYNKPCDYHFLYCHAVNNLNSQHHAVPGIEGTTL